MKDDAVTVVPERKLLSENRGPTQVCPVNVATTPLVGLDPFIIKLMSE